MTLLAFSAIVHRPNWQVLAALSYSLNPDGVWFINPQQWVNHHLFQHVSIWKIPLVKPRFTCSMDMKLSLRGYDVAYHLRRRMDSFRDGATCESGFITHKLSDLRAKEHVEFGEAAQAEMPDIANYDISVMYRSFEGDAHLLDISLPTVIRHFPSAREVVVVVFDNEEAAFKEIAERYGPSAPFPILVVAEPKVMDGSIQQKHSKVSCSVSAKSRVIYVFARSPVVFLRS